MPELPLLSGREVIKIFQRLGFVMLRQRGSHMILRRGSSGCVVPDHKEVARGTLRSAIRQAGILPEEFIQEYQRG